MESSCVFCHRRSFQERLIAETPSLYFIATLGQITDGGYTLIVPKRHVSCIGAMREEEIFDIERASEACFEAIRQEYGVRPIMFEHGIAGQSVQHAHLHLVPAAVHLCDRISRDFPANRIYFLSSLDMLRRIWAQAEGKKYLFWSTPDGLLKAVADPSAPPQYLRTITAEFLGHPERADWRSIDPELDKRFWLETVLRMRKYF